MHFVTHDSKCAEENDHNTNRKGHVALTIDYAFIDSKSTNSFYLIGLVIS